MEQLKIKHASAMPAPTWSWLRMNDTEISLPAALARGGDIEIEAPDTLLDTASTFEGALAELQERLDAKRANATDDRACVRAAQMDQEGACGRETSDGSLGDLDTPALSRYQKRATLEEVAGDVTRAFETGIGMDARSYLNFAAGETVTIATEAGSTGEATIRVAGDAETTVAASIDAVAAPDSSLSLTIALDAAPGSSDDASSNQGPAGVIGSELRIFAGARSHVDVTVYVTADAGFVALDDSGYVLDEGARVQVRHIVLGGGVTATGMAADLRSDTARIDIDTRYLASGTERRDFNYVVRHRGKRTISNIIANGVLAGSSKKCLRGTIDLVHGCKGSEGTERETVLIADEGVENKTVPTILCDEDDVAGNHGATIGHVRPEQLFYLESRGVSSEDAEALFIRAKLEDAVLSAPDERIRAAILRLGDRLIDGFAEELEGDAA